jgi:hypothetical protein
MTRGAACLSKVILGVASCLFHGCHCLEIGHHAPSFFFKVYVAGAQRKQSKKGQPYKMLHKSLQAQKSLQSRNSLQVSPRKSRALDARLALLPPELLRLIALYLKPRHLYKLMLASKRLLQIVDCESYWQRAAAHAVLRHVHGLEIDPDPGQVCRFPKRQGLFNVVNVEDYRESVDCVIGRARQMLGDHLSVPELVLAGEAIILVDPDNYRHIHAAIARSAETMKAMVERETRRVLAEQTSVGRKAQEVPEGAGRRPGAVEVGQEEIHGEIRGPAGDVAEDEMIETAQDFV